MSLQIIYGRSGTGKTSYIFQEISENIDNGKKKYIITPEQFSFTAEKELLNCIPKEAVINAEVLTFARMAHRVSSEVGGSNKNVLSNCGKSMLIYSILSDKKNNLKFLGKSDNNIDMIMTQITELKKHGVTLDNLKNLKEQIAQTDTYLEKKLDDVYIVYSKFQEKITDNYIDENDSLSILETQLDKTDMFKDTEIYIDEFVGFTKQEYAIISKLLNKANKVTITVTTDSLNKSLEASNDIFYTNKETVERILKIAKEAGSRVEEAICVERKIHSLNKGMVIDKITNKDIPEKVCSNEIVSKSSVPIDNTINRFKSEELAHIEANLYSFPYRIYDKPVKNLRLFLANNQYSEIEEVAKKITNLVRNENYRYRDIAVITKNIDIYSNLCKAIFDKYKIPVYIDEKRELSQNILVKYLIAILDIFARNWSYDSVFNYIKSGFIDIEQKDIYLLENYALKWDIKGSKWYKEDWNFHDEDDVGLDVINHINELRRKIIDPLLELKNNLSGNKTAKQISENLYNFFIKNNIDKKLEEKIVKLNEIQKVNIAAEYETSWKVVMQVLDEIVLVFGNDNITFENYMQILKTGLGESKLGTIPMAQDEVTVGDVDRSRSHKIKVIFIIGLNDGMFPSVNRAEGFLNDDDREKIKLNGVELAKGTIERIYEDNFNIYKAFTTAEEKMYLSYSSSDIEGKSLRPSVLISRIKKIFTNLKEDSDIINRTSEISTIDNTFEELLINLRNFRDGNQIDSKWFNIYNIYDQNPEWHNKLEAAIKGLNYENIPEKITKENILKMYGNTLRTSVSKLEQYSGCPFSYYLKYGLKLNEKETFDVQAIDTGSFMHDVIDSFFTVVDDREISLKKITDEEIESIISEIITDKLKLSRNYIFTSTEKYKALANRLKKVITMSMKYIVQSIKQSEFQVFGHEVEFGGYNEKSSKKVYNPIIVTTEDGTRVEIVGKIDRVDILKNPDGTYVRIIDYKSSIKNIDLNQVASGLQLQLLTYLNETCKVEDFIPAGVLYFNLLNKKLGVDKNVTDEELENRIKQEFKMKGLILADVNIIKKMDTDIENTGTSTVIPAGIKKDGEINARNTNAITKEQFEHLQKYIDKTIKQISEQILGGNIDIKPYYNTKNKSTPCEYCKYKSICRFDENNSCGSYNYISNLNKEAILEMMKEKNVQ